MATDTKLTELVINSMTQEQFDELETKDQNQIYGITDAKITAQDLETTNDGTAGQILAKTEDGMAWIDMGVPVPPTDTGNYVLKAIVAADGTTTTQWVAE